jgi:hypothetical protein
VASDPSVMLRAGEWRLSRTEGREDGEKSYDQTTLPPTPGKILKIGMLARGRASVGNAGVGGFEKGLSCQGLVIRRAEKEFIIGVVVEQGGDKVPFAAEAFGEGGVGGGGALASHRESIAKQIVSTSNCLDKNGNGTGERSNGGAVSNSRESPVRPLPPGSNYCHLTFRFLCSIRLSILLRRDSLMSFSCGGIRSSVLRFTFASLTSALVCLPSFAQNPSVPAPHRPIPPVISPAQPLHSPAVARALRGGLWMTDASMKSRLHITNDLVTSSLSVTPVLWLSNGVKYVLPAVNLAPSGTAIVDINQALADQGLAPYGTLSGYVEIDYQWPWDALCATIVNVDVAHSVIFNYSLQMGMPAAPTPQATAQATSQTLEGLWWKQEPNVTGFVALTNPGSQAMSAILMTSDSLGNPIGQNAVTVSPHGTKMVNLALLPQTAGAAGGLRVVYTGSANDLLVSGGLRDDATGYSTNISFAPPPGGPPQASTVSAAAVGLMTGAADPMLSFPAGTIFTPYAVVRNISSQPLSFAPNFWWMVGGVAKNAALSQVSLAPYQALKLDVLSLLAQAGLKNYNGSVNLVLNIGANTPRGAMLFSTGSVDRNNTYVFQVNPGNVKESIAKNLSYWSTANGDDTMVTLWNPADEAQDFLFTLFYSGGHYKYPTHLEPRATSMFNVSEILHSAIPDADGNVIPVGVQEGSAELAGSQGEAQHILVIMDAGTYNVQKAICGTHCVTCQGAVNSWVTDSPFAVAVSGQHQLTFTVQNHSGTQVNDTAPAYWNSSNASVATVSSGLVNGVAAGSLNANVQDDGYPLYATQCFPQGVTTDCPIATGTGSGSPGIVGPYRVEPIATNVQGSAVCPSGYSGWSRTTTNQLQYQNGSGVLAAGITMADILQITSTNQLGITGTQTGSYPTDSNGSWPDTYFVCSRACPTSGETDGIQTWTYNSIPLPHSNLIVYKCSSITIDGY